MFLHSWIELFGHGYSKQHAAGCGCLPVVVVDTTTHLTIVVNTTALFRLSSLKHRSSPVCFWMPYDVDRRTCSPLPTRVVVVGRSPFVVIFIVCRVLVSPLVQTFARPPPSEPLLSHCLTLNHQIGGSRDALRVLFPTARFRLQSWLLFCGTI